MKWLHRVHMAHHTRRALDLLLLTLVIVGGLAYWKSTWPHPDLARWRALTGPTVKITRTWHETRTIRTADNKAIRINIKHHNPLGGGVIVARCGNAHFVLTSNHLIRMLHATYEIRHSELGLPARVHVLKRDETNDLALIMFFSDTQLPVAPIAKYAPYSTARIWLCGWGAGMEELRVGEGVLGKKSWKSTPSPEHIADLWHFSGATWWGDSGGGFWTDKHELIGIMCCKSLKRTRVMEGHGVVQFPVEGQGGFVPLPVIREFLKPMGFVEKVSDNPGEVQFCLDKGDGNGENQD